MGGGWIPEAFWEVSNETWQKARAANLDGAFYSARAAAQRMLEQGWGRIIGVTTSLDTMWSKDCASYGATKAGQESLVAIMAEDLKGTGVSANVLIPVTMTHGEMIAWFIGLILKDVSYVSPRSCSRRSFGWPVKNPVTLRAAESLPTGGTRKYRWRSV